MNGEYIFVFFREREWTECRTTASYTTETKQLEENTVHISFSNYSIVENQEFDFCTVRSFSFFTPIFPNIYRLNWNNY